MPRHASTELLAAIKDTAKFKRQKAVKGMTLSGVCPDCEHQTDIFVPIKPTTIPTAGMLATAQEVRSAGPIRRSRGLVQAGAPLSFLARPECACSNKECKDDDQDPPQEGCGAYARIIITVPQGGRTG